MRARMLNVSYRLAVGLIGLTVLGQGVMGQVISQSPDKLWQSLDSNKIAVGVGQLSSLTSLPQTFRTFRLDRSKLTTLLQSSHGALTSHTGCNGAILTLPKPSSDNVWLRFCVGESPIMEPELAAAHPTIKTYEGQGLDDPSMTVRLDWTPKGFHAMVLNANETFFIDPLPLHKGDLSTYMGYFDRDAQQKPFQCNVKTDAVAKNGPTAEKSIPLISNGDTLRTYRLAMAATGEYTQFHGGTKEAALAAIVTTMNRVNAIYNHDLAIHLILVKDQMKIIHTDPATDPYSNDNAGNLLSENQQNLDKEIGTNNYDIGHVFGTGGGGLAALGVVGDKDRKARGETGSRSPRGDPFDVDFVAHEIGHQFGANHTFNGTSGSCGGNRNVSTAFEPGSGSTIMAYAGICGPEDLQANSDPFFHVASLYEILSYLNSDGVKAVGKLTSTHNTNPNVKSGSSFLIPKQTPFSLTASATDQDGDRLSYVWEQVDLGKEGPPNDDNNDVRPIFRSFNPEANASRVFPKLEALLNGGPSVGEALPSKDRTMHFMVTARDNRAGGGAFGTGASEVSVVTSSGPFVVTQPTQASVWTAGKTYTVRWDVAGTASAPINCLNVRISFSSDGGETFITLKESTPNTGAATIAVPNSGATKGRLKVEAVGNIFFNISKGDFRVLTPN